MGHSFRHRDAHTTKFNMDPNFGNTWEFAAKVLADHWREVHKGSTGGSGRPYACHVCRDLWIRASQEWQKIHDEEGIKATPVPYHTISIRIVRLMEAYKKGIGGRPKKSKTEFKTVIKQGKKKTAAKDLGR